MTRAVHVTLFVVFVSAGAGMAATPTQASSHQLRSPSSRNSCAENARKPTAQERIVQRDIQEVIDQSLEADEARDWRAQLNPLTSDFTLTLLDGTTLNRSQVQEGIRRDFDSILAISDQTSIKIDCLTLSGKQATVYTNQHYVRTMPDRKDGSPHEVITNVRHRETWIYNDRGWMVKHVAELEQGQTYLDGEPYNP